MKKFCDGRQNHPQICMDVYVSDISEYDEVFLASFPYLEKTKGGL
jgi:hypothetical protein